MKTKLMMVAALLSLTALPAMAAVNLKMLNDSTPAYTMQVLTQIGDVKPGVYASICIEKNETFSQNTSYYGVMNTAYQAVQGGNVWVGGFGSGSVTASGGTDTLDYRTAWLFSQFIEKNASYQNQAALQAAIHYIEAEDNTNQVFSTNWASSSTVWKQYVAAADAAVVAGYNTYGGVRVLNLWNDAAHTKFAQDQIVYVPAPGAVVLASMGMAFVGYLRRRQSI